MLFCFDVFSKSAEVLIPRFPFHNLTRSCSLFISVSVCITPSPRPRFRLQYSLDVADRLADEHVLIGVYVSMLQSNPARLVQVWRLWGTQERDLAQPHSLIVSSWPQAGAALHEHKPEVNVYEYGVCPPKAGGLWHLLLLSLLRSAGYC